MNTVLIVDDDMAIQKLLQKVLKSSGLESKAVSNGEEAIELIRTQKFDLVLLDIMLGGIDGFQVIEELRKSGNHIPVIVVSGQNEDYDMLYGLELGADDYITKPFNPVILGAKVKALIRRNNQSMDTNADRMKAGIFELDTTTMKFYKRGREVFLSAKETALMSFFMKHSGQVFTKEQLYNQIWEDTVVDTNTVMVYINHLRNKLEDDPKNPEWLLTVWGIGYKFVGK